MSFALNLNNLGFPITTNNKWRIRSSVVVTSHRNNTQLRLSNPSLTNLINVVTSSSSIVKFQRPNHVTRATSILANSTHESTMNSELEKKRTEGYWLRKWDRVDITHLCLIVSKHGLAVCAPFVLNWGAFWVTVVLSLFTGLGITLGYHRLLTHRSFKLPKWLEYFFAYCGVHAGERDPIFWVSVHKNHHMYADTEKDPHSPKEGFWFSHIGWFHHNEYLAAKCGESRSGAHSNVPELKSQWFYRFLHQTYVFHTIALAALLYQLGGFPYLAWGMGMRAVLVNHCTFLATSASHLWGERPWNTPDTSTNNWWVAMLTLGEGWHNNHHAFPWSARHGLEWWQLDFTWEVIKLLEMVGLATNVKLPTEVDKRRLISSLDESKQMKLEEYMYV